MSKSRKRNELKRKAKKRAHGQPDRPPCRQCDLLKLNRAPKYDDKPREGVMFSGYHCPSCRQVWIKLAALTDTGTTLVQWRKAFVVNKNTGEYRFEA